MKRIASWLGDVSYAWLDGFRRRYELKPSSGNATPAQQAPILLHVGCGQASIDQIALPGFQDAVWREVRLDADPSVNPEIVGTMADMSAVTTGFADVVFSSHGIEHLYWHDVPRALAEFHRTLKDTGFAVITCPDVQAAAEMIAQDRMFDTAYESAAGPITPFDMLYSYRPFVEANPQWMSHHCGFTLSTLTAVLRDAGFQSTFGVRRVGGFDLWVLASKSKRSREELEKLAEKFLPSAH